MDTAQNSISEILAGVTPPKVTRVTEEESLNNANYTETEQSAVANHLSDKYRKALEQEHSTDLVSKHTEQVLRDGAVLAAQQIVSLAIHCSNPNTRLKAATYVVDRVLGPVGKSDNVGDKFAELLMAASKGVTS